MNTTDPWGIPILFPNFDIFTEMGYWETERLNTLLQTKQ